ncbi:peptidoglycan DD-metalloendopeptidase family protein, partial [Campylobacter coli]
KKPSGALHEETFRKEEEFYQSYGGKEGVLKALELGKIRKVNGILKRYRAHLGIDYAAPTGTPVKSAGKGTITFVGTKGGYGNVI